MVFLGGSGTFSVGGAGCFFCFFKSMVFHYFSMVSV